MGRHIWIANSNNIPIGMGTWTCSVGLYKTYGKHDQNMPIDNDDNKESRYDSEDGIPIFDEEPVGHERMFIMMGGFLY